MKLANIFKPFSKRANTSTQLLFGLTSTQSASGKIVTQDTALQVAAVWACVRVLSETLATLPLFLYRRLPGGGKERVLDHPAFKVLHTRPNSYQTSVTFLEQMQAQCVLRGNTYAQKIFDQANRLKELIPLDASWIEPTLTPTAQVEFKINQPGKQQRVMTQDDILHIPALIISGAKGKSPIDAARDSFGQALAQEEHGARYFANSAAPIGVLEHPGTLSKEAQDRLRGSWNETYGGVKNSSKVAILEEGMKLNSFSFSPEQSQFIQSRSHQVVEICRWFRMPPHMIGHMDKATFSNIEQQSLEFVIYTMRPWFVRWEKALNLSLLNEDEQEELFFEFLVDALLRGATVDRFNAYKIAREGGWLNIDEIREMENRSPLPNDEGKQFLLTPPGMTNVPDGTPATTGQEEDNEPEPQDEGDQERSVMKLSQFCQTFAPMFSALVGRPIRKELKRRADQTKANAIDTFMITYEQNFRDDYGLAVIPIFDGLNRQLRATTDWALFEPQELFTRWWAHFQTHIRKAELTEAELGQMAFDLLLDTFNGAYYRDDRPAPPTVNIHLEPKPSDVNVSLTQAIPEKKPEPPKTRIVKKDIVLRHDETGKPIGMQVIEEVEDANT